MDYFSQLIRQTGLKIGGGTMSRPRKVNHLETLPPPSTNIGTDERDRLIESIELEERVEHLRPMDREPDNPAIEPQKSEPVKGAFTTQHSCAPRSVQTNQVEASRGQENDILVSSKWFDGDSRAVYEISIAGISDNARSGTSSLAKEKSSFEGPERDNAKENLIQEEAIHFKQPHEDTSTGEGRGDHHEEQGDYYRLVRHWVAKTPNGSEAEGPSQINPIGSSSNAPQPLILENETHDQPLSLTEKEVEQSVPEKSHDHDLVLSIDTINVTVEGAQKERSPSKNLPFTPMAETQARPQFSRLKRRYVRV